jgi:hypothetical protein
MAALVIAALRRTVFSRMSTMRIELPIQVGVDRF